MSSPDTNPEIRKMSEPDRAAARMRQLATLTKSLSSAQLPETVVDSLCETLDRMFPGTAYAVRVTDPDDPDFVIERFSGMGDASPVVARLTVAAKQSEPVLFDGNTMTASFETAGRNHGAALVSSETCVLDNGAQAAFAAAAALAGLALHGTRLIDRLTAGKREWEYTVDAIPQAFCIIDERERVRRGNLAFCELVDRPVQAFANRSWRELMPARWIEPVGRVLALKVSERLRIDDRQFLVSSLPVRRPAVKLTLLIFEDVTTQEELQSHLAQSAKMTALGQLVSGVAHDLNNPLASVVGYADYLVSGTLEIPEKLEPPLAAIREEAGRASTIVKQLLSFARKQDDTRRPCDMREILETTVLLIKNQLAGAGASVSLEVEDNLPLAFVNFGQIQQVFVNLINNAAQAIASSGTGYEVGLTARQGTDGIEVFVEDNGPGIDPEVRQHIFEPFFTTKSPEDGTGLGLSICQGILSQHGGSISLVESESGARFRVSLPVTVEASDAEIRDTVRLPSMRILVVDDEAHILHFLKATMEAWGQTVDLAQNGDEALATIERAEPDVILSDLRMPNIAGKALLERLETERPQLARRLVFMTGDTMHAETDTFLASVPNAHLKKPFTLAQLHAALASVDVSSTE